MTAAHAFELPPEQGRDLVLPAAEVEAVEHGEAVSLTRQGRTVARIVPTAPDQWWFWTPEWQAGERDVDAELSAPGRRPVHMAGEAFLAQLSGTIEEMNRADTHVHLRL